MEQYFTNNPNLKSELRTIVYKHNDKIINFYSDNGVFSKDKLDFGSSLLLDTFLKNINNNVNNDRFNILDVGCGYGYLGISIAKFLSVHVIMCDVNKRALHLARRNADENGVGELCQVLESDVYQNITGIYDFIITNPPIRAGKNVVYGILDGARDYLKEDGELWMVIRKSQGAKSTISHLEKIYNCEIVTKSKGFYIIKATKH